MIKHIFKLIWNKRKANALIMLEILLAFLILCSVLVFSIFNLQRYNRPLGYQTEDVYVCNLNWPPGTDSVDIVSVRQKLLAELKNQPNIANASFCMGSTFPMGGGVWTMGDQTDDGLQYYLHYIEADEAFADVMQFKILEGRWYNKSDQESKYPPVVINQKLREKLFKDTTALGQILRFSGEKKIVGVIEDIKYYGEFGDIPNLAVVDYPEASSNQPVLAIKLNPGTGISYEEKLNTLIGKMIGDWNFTAYYYDSRRAIKSRETWVPMIILMGISTFLILNVSLGLFGVLWQNIQKRRPEIGLRQATGATRQKIYIQFILEMVLMASMGIFLGLLIAIQFPLLKVIDIGNDIFFKAMATAALIIYVLVVLCSYYPSRQASLIQPAKVLHEE